MYELKKSTIEYEIIREIFRRIDLQYKALNEIHELIKEMRDCMVIMTECIGKLMDDRYARK